jgi:hypothetical protein
MTIRPFLDGYSFDPETTRLMGIAFEMARSAVTRRAGLTDEIIAGRIIELAKTGERNADVLCEAALNTPADAGIVGQSAARAHIIKGGETSG